MTTFTSALGAFFEWVLQVSWQASLLAGLVLLAQRIFRERLSANGRFALWILILLRLALPASIESPVSIFNAAPFRFDRQGATTTPVLGMGGLARPGTRTVLKKAQIPAAGRTGSDASRAGSAASELRGAIAVPGGAQRSADLDATGAQGFARGGEQARRSDSRAVPSAARWGGPAVAAIPWLWLGGVLVIATRLIYQNIRFAARLRRARPVEAPEVQRLFESGGNLMEVRRMPTLLETDAVQSPAVCGLWRPRLLLPSGMATAFSAQELRFVFLHELGHVKRWDMAVNWLMGIFQALHWFNPLLWFAFNRMRADRELACDALVLSRAEEGASQPYGETIIKILAGMSHPASQPGLVGILEDKRQLKDRIRMIARFQRRSTWPGAAMALLAGLGVITLTDAQSNPQTPAAPPTESAAASSAAPVDRPSNGQPHVVWPGPGREVIARRLQEIQVDQVGFKNAPLSEVIQALAKWSREADREKRGLNFILNPHGTGTNLFAAPITLHLGKVRLVDVLDAVTKVAPVPIQYTIEDYAVVFLQRTSEKEQLFTRTYKVDPNTFVEELDRVVGTSGPMETNAPLAVKIRNFFIAAGIDFPRPEALATNSQGTPGLGDGQTGARETASNKKGFFFSERTGLLLVRATMDELDLVEKAVQMLNATPRQVRLEARLVEVSQAEQKTLGFDWFLGNTLMKGAPGEDQDPNPARSAPVFPGAPTVGLRGAPNGGPATLTGILTDPQFRVVLRALEQRTGSKTVCNPVVTTVSGRRTRMEVPALGFTLDALPTVLADGVSISVETDFALRPSGDSETGQVESADRSPLRVSTKAVIWDGQTMVLGSFPTAPTRSDDEDGAAAEAHSRLFLFITPAIIDPAGNRVHDGPPVKR
ncbi:MAG: M56 family metallopeptidase [Verrucomicrobiia bacterium]